MNKIKKIIYATAFFVMAFTWSSFSQYTFGDYGSIANGSWNSVATWGTWDGVSAFNPAGIVPGVNDNVFIVSGFTVTVPISSSSSTCKDLTVENTAVLYTNNTVLNSNGYVNVYGNIYCEGIIGNGVTYDNISFNIEGANDTISGAGTFDASRIRKSATANTTTNLVINRNVNLHFYGPGAGTAIYNNGNAACMFNVTVGSGVTLTLDSISSANLSGAAIDGITGATNGINLGGTFTINGTMDVQGIVYLYTQDNTGIYSCKWVINNGGELRAYQLKADIASGIARDSIIVNNGGKLNLTGAPAFVTGAGTNTNNYYIFNTGSTVEYSAPANQTVQESANLGGLGVNSYWHLTISGSGTKTTTSNAVLIRGNFTISNASGSPVFNPGTQQVRVGGNWINYNQSAFLEGTLASNLVSLNGAGTQKITCPGGEVFNNLTLSNTGNAATDSIYLSDDIIVDSVLTFANTDNLPLYLNGHQLTLLKSFPSDPALLTGAIIVFTAGAGAPNRYIVSETAVGSANYASNPSIIRWKLGTAAGAYVFPFGVGGTKIPVTIGKKASAIDTVSISTRATSSNNMPWDTTTNVPLVNNMNHLNTTDDNSDTAVVDRWWDIVPSSPLPVDSIIFTYRGTENTMVPPYQLGEVFPQNWGLIDGIYGWFGRNCTDRLGNLISCTTGTLAATGTIKVFNDTLRYAPWVLVSRARPLPISLLEFTATLNNKTVETNWTTASEINNEKFTVERSTDARTFAGIGSVAGSGTTSETHSYSWTDMNPFPGLSYYRLRQTDYDGRFTFSEIVPVLNKDKNSGWYVFPNPATDMVNIASAGSHDLLGATFQLFNAEGSLLKTVALDTKNESIISVDIRDLSKGIYIGKITDDYNQQVFKIIKD